MLEAILLLSLERVVVSGERTPRGPRGVPHLLSVSSAVENLSWHGFGKICGDERGIDDGKYGMDEGQGRPRGGVGHAADAGGEERMIDILKQFGRKQ